MGEWANGIFGCFSNCGLCIVTYIAPCYTMGKNAEALGDSCCCFCFCFFVPIVNIVMRVSQRTRIREQQGIDGNDCTDILCVCFMPFCSLVQEAQEVKLLTRVVPGGDQAQDIERA